jgi:hypothetical protein
MTYLTSSTTFCSSSEARAYWNDPYVCRIYEIEKREKRLL